MTLVNHGFNGSLDEASFAQMMGIEGAEGVDVSASWAVTQGAGRQVSVAASSGWAAAAGVSSKDDTGAITASLSTPVAGQWYLITRRIDWSAHACTVQAIAHTTTTATIPTLPPTTYPTYNQTPGTLYDQPLAWAWVRNTDTTMALFDLRALPARTRFAALEAILLRNVADLDTLVTYDATLTEGRVLNVDEFNADFQAQDGVWVQLTTGIFATSTARDTAYAKGSAAFRVAGAMSRVVTDRFDRRYNGSAWKPYGSAKFPVVPSSIVGSTGSGTPVAIGPDGVLTCVAATAIAFTGFGEFDNYSIDIIGDGVTSLGMNFQLRLGTAAAIATGYDSKSSWDTGAAHTTNADSNNATIFLAAVANTATRSRINLDVFGPNIAKETSFHSSYFGSTVATGANMLQGISDGSQRNATAYDGGVLTPSAAFTGTVRITGWNND